MVSGGARTICACKFKKSLNFNSVQHLIALLAAHLVKIKKLINKRKYNLLKI
jgi:hypothetical protein